MDGKKRDAWLGDVARLREDGFRSVAFLCVANSARSQLAEAIARDLAPHMVKVYSAGSVPTAVRSEVRTVLAELGIDWAGQKSKGLDEIPIANVDVVITLCAEEQCPVVSASGVLLNWELPDPAAAQGPAKMEGFRQARDELLRRLQRLFLAPQ